MTVDNAIVNSFITGPSSHDGSLKFKTPLAKHKARVACLLEIALRRNKTRSFSQVGHTGVFKQDELRRMREHKDGMWVHSLFANVTTQVK